MARRSKTEDPEAVLNRLMGHLGDLPPLLRSDDLRRQVRSLIQAHHLLRDLGGSIAGAYGTSARERILGYMLRHAGQVVDGDELMVVAGISEYARRIRE